MDKHRQLIHWLFETEAFRVADPEHPFWYTSGKFGPYYINTHFLFGSERAANELLGAIDKALECPLAVPRLIGKLCIQQYHSDEKYHDLIDMIAEELKKYEFEYISGGERRDFFFSYPVAEALGKPHLTIFKDGRMFLSTVGFKESKEVHTDELKGARVLHTADLVTEASSYFRAWLPSIANAGAQITDTFAVVDRRQGGCEMLAENNVALHSFVQIEEPFFRAAEEEGRLTHKQYEQLVRFTEDPDRFILDFLAEHPGFLEQEEKRDAKTAERVARFRKLNLT